MRKDQDGANTPPRITALALSLGALAAAAGVAGAAPMQADHQNTSASQAAQFRLGDIRAQFETAFRPGSVDVDKADSWNGLIDEGPGTIIEVPRAVTEPRAQG